MVQGILQKGSWSSVAGARGGEGHRFSGVSPELAQGPQAPSLCVLTNFGGLGAGLARQREPAGPGAPSPGARSGQDREQTHLLGSPPDPQPLARPH